MTGVSLGNSFDGCPQHAGQCQSRAILAGLRLSTQSQTAIAHLLYVGKPFGVDLNESVHALSTTSIDRLLAANVEDNVLIKRSLE